MSDIQAVVLDLDGTLLGSDKSISPRNYEAVKRCYDSGIHIIVAAARPPRAANQLEISHQINHFIKLHAAQSIINYEVNDSCYTCTPISDSELIHFGIRSSDPKPLVVDKDFLSSLSPTKILVHGYSAWIDIIEQFGDHVNVIATDGGVLVQIMHKSASKECRAMGA
ncbi:HAD family hydrolase [Paenibacillus glycanilyticus]|uniref:HAD family hydrolase n=1 Tax=Paenibacillus glycanilyticus TaxID=126569 RepID=UPI003EBC3C31